MLEKLTLILCEGILLTNFYAHKLKCLNELRYEITSEYSLSSAPNLCKLNISAENFVEDDLKQYQIDSEACSMDYLDIVTFNNFRGLKAKLELVKFLLESSPMLKKNVYPRQQSLGCSGKRYVQIDVTIAHQERKLDSGISPLI
ncbi:hypothetical protein POM88_014854 [Heracleum sosnowskyi]|uniref:FBD domain-containing protein n=1 Tax=Heracleum sosnowskyi TaxID=360622 RepID=A0AAD8IJG1_9APIA|nr:hypothetical protein POM88_014854 [Heracleum sosnowskyi]